MTAPILLWQRRDLRLTDNPAMAWAAAQGRPVIPVYVLDECMAGWGAAPSWRMGRSLEVHAKRMEEIGSRLILRRGDALPTLRALIEETGADTVVWNRLYVADEKARDEGVKAALKEDGIEAKSFHGHTLFEPWEVESKTGGFYKVFTPFWRAVRDRDLDAPLAPVEALEAPSAWPASDDLTGWKLAARMVRGAEVVERYARIGELEARARLVEFCDGPVADYADARDMLADEGTSGLSENLTYGEISARECWFAGWRAHEEGKAGAETFVKELVWRDFAHHLAYHTPRLTSDNWKEEWDAFPWRGDNEDAEAWRRGRTGIEVVDAAMRQLYASGTMHNRARMLVASLLTKHMMTHWKVGLDWFADCLIDWDPASNAMGWQWTAGSGPDAAPFFRVFNPDTQAEKFDPEGRYRRRWVAELSGAPRESRASNAPDDALAFFEAIPRSWGLSPSDRYPDPVVDLKAGRERALEAYSARAAAE
ncbi:deoxyribodipyrimidine photo-lyase [Jannaschia sp. Os4]|uniref:cryptochrome/photolyase family protein n=1 Tax=Jannaschia sp. Os4 TaxID=2807617 RepID=UPI00193AA8DC|nr:deoxyribodipyrimidine photo-lyase [Jannaschia sp. Os4]MBM2577974.1 deoxyribodipyrimidine photo-lyase [Jannaschia sp. Os4]